MTAHCKAFPSYQDRAAETASSTAGFLIERLEVPLCSLHQTRHFTKVTQSPHAHNPTAPRMEFGQGH